MRESYFEVRKVYRQALQANRRHAYSELTEKVAPSVKATLVPSEYTVLGIFLEESGDHSDASIAFDTASRLETWRSRLGFSGNSAVQHELGFFGQPTINPDGSVMQLVPVSEAID